MATPAGQALVRQLQISAHALERMVQRGISADMMKRVVERGAQYFDPKNKSVVSVLEKGMASGKDILVARNPVDGLVTTGIVGERLVRSRFIPLDGKVF